MKQLSLFPDIVPHVDVPSEAIDPLQPIYDFIDATFTVQGLICIRPMDFMRYLFYLARESSSY